MVQEILLKLQKSQQSDKAENHGFQGNAPNKRDKSSK